MKNISYSVLASLVCLVCFILITIFQYDRVFDANKEAFLYFRYFFIGSVFFFTVYFWKYKFSDLSGAVFSIILMVYIISMMWFMPVYEAAYFQISLASAFLPFKRSWLHPVISFFGMIGILTNYYLQDSIQWTLPAVSRADWISIIVITFALAFVIQNFVIASHRRDQENLRRFGVIGRDAARLTHDLKGLISSPMLLLEFLRDKKNSLPPEAYEQQMNLLIDDMNHIREKVISINRLALTNGSASDSNINLIITKVTKLLVRRLSHIDISLPEERVVKGNAEILHSIFFNLFINSIQAFEKKESLEQAKIEIYWLKNHLYFKDNAGGLSKSDEVGLGLELIGIDAKSLGAEFSIWTEGTNTIAEFRFGKSVIV